MATVDVNAVCNKCGKSHFSFPCKGRKAAIVEAGREHLKEWLLTAESHGTIYYNIDSVSRSGMSRKIVLSTIFIDSKGKADLRRLWPGYGDQELPPGASDHYSDTIDIIARDWGFSFRAQAFDVGGCGMDMVFALVDQLAGRAGLNRHDGKPNGSYANRVRREAF